MLNFVATFARYLVPNINVAMQLNKIFFKIPLSANYIYHMIMIWPNFFFAFGIVDINDNVAVASNFGSAVFATQNRRLSSLSGAKGFAVRRIMAWRGRKTARRPLLLRDPNNSIANWRKKALKNLSSISAPI